MLNLSYDFHLHSCLSPCADDDMTPGNIVGMAAIKKLDVIALTDHNSCKNCPPFMKYAEEFGIIGIPGMELCTAEEVHVICLFETLEEAMSFDAYVYEKLPAFQNNPSIFGKQQICNKEDEIISLEPNLLINATTIPFHQVYDLVTKYHGIMIPAHIDKTTNSILSNLGFIPGDSKFHCAEISDLKNLHSLRRNNPYLNTCNIITNSDAHYLYQINEPDNYIYSDGRNPRNILNALKRG